MAATSAAADPGTAFKLLLSCPAGLPRSRVSVKFGQSFDRIPHPDAGLEESICEIWNQRLQRNPSLYNGTKFRYGGNAVHYKDDSKQDYHVSLHLGLTDYRTFVGTNLNPLWEKFLVPSEGATMWGSFQDTTFSLEDTRSHKKLASWVIKLMKKTRLLSVNKFHKKCLKESSVKWLRKLEFLLLPWGVNELYSKAQDGYESTKLYAVSVEELRGMGQRMPGCHNGGFALYELMRNDAKSLCRC
ncbi:nudix hydrolase 9 isoform X2 [Setaria italica]|uniref:Uncharacterized protein n=1 Tax=Setaria italica TaxID=4555 RepID=K3Z966_SETIT|nr:nudix hydrolase 9 isoform X2 [Setaria italica]XP_034583794.1 nudix hydrolase 9 isoform X2 [Setaria viridis]